MQLQFIAGNLFLKVFQLLGPDLDINKFVPFTGDNDEKDGS